MPNESQRKREARASIPLKVRRLKTVEVWRSASMDVRLPAPAAAGAMLDVRPTLEREGLGPCNKSVVAHRIADLLLSVGGCHD